MIVIHEIKRKVERERACLVAVQLRKDKSWDVEESVEELRMLVDSAGADTFHQMIVAREKPVPAFYIGKGKVEQLKEILLSKDLNLVVFDNDLSPAQERNLREFLEVKVLDRTELILDIFAQRAVTSEGKLQIELAQLNYMLPRLTRLWTHLSRQVGGIGTRGPGEKQLEVDRRRVRERIFRLQKDLRKIKSERDIQRQHRIRRGYPLISLVGYTNAGKSTLFNTLTKANAAVKDQLFSTLMPLSRQITLPNNQKAILSDTVGFLNKLPHHLIEAFKATLEEVVVADLLIHVMDATSLHLEAKHMAVMEVLDELGAIKKPVINVINKIDLVKNPFVIERALRNYSHSVAICAKRGDGTEKLLEEVVGLIGKGREFCRFLIPHEKSGLINEIFHSGFVCEKAYRDDGVYISAEVSSEVKGLLKDYLVK
ncbi:MAG: GTPase HflX [Candidatus Aureabacteria bacterium]|nr:GTPase HflX [Candidatus Auribacterota bacterium]